MGVHALFSGHSFFVMVVLGTTIHEFACNGSPLANETRGWSDQDSMRRWTVAALAILSVVQD